MAEFEFVAAALLGSVGGEAEAVAVVFAVLFEAAPSALGSDSEAMLAVGVAVALVFTVYRIE